MNDNELWIRVWKLIAVVVCVITVSIAGSCSYGKYTIKKMVESGASPMEAACSLTAYSEQSHTRVDCSIYLLTGKE